MKTFSSALTNALTAAVKEPVWLLQLDMVSGEGQTTLYLSDRPVTLWGQSWKPLVLSWGAIDRYFDPSRSEVKVSDVTVELDNRPGALGTGMKNISWYFRTYDLAASTARVYLWLDNAGLAEPSGNNLNDLVSALTGRPELASEIGSAVAPLDIVYREGEFDDENCPWGPLLQGQYTRNQWGTLPAAAVGAWKPAVFGNDVVVEGIPLGGPIRVGKVEGPSTLFDPAAGADTVEISFPDGGEYNAANPVAAPVDIYVGDWRLPVKRPPVKGAGSTWVYAIDSESSYAFYHAPAPLTGATPLFAPSANTLWPRSDESGDGPYATDEPPSGHPYQFYHGAPDTGNWRDGYHPGRAGATIKNVYADGVAIQAADMNKDDPFGIVWLRAENNAVLGKAGDPETLRTKWTGVDSSFTTGDTWLRSGQLTAKRPHGYNADTAPCILGDFAVPASGGGAPASSKLGLVNSIRYPFLGARIASVRFVMTYTGVETSPGTFHFQVFGASHSFASSELADGSGIEGAGFTVSSSQKGPQFEIWPNNNGFPYTQTSPDPRYWTVYELSKDVTQDALNHLALSVGFSDSFRAWFTGTQWPNTNSVIVLACELEIKFDPVESLLRRPRVTALIGGSSTTAGEVLAEVIPAGERGSGFDDPSLADVKYHLGEQQSVCAFVRKILAESNTGLKKNFTTGKWDLVKRSDTRDNANLPPATGGEADIVQSDLLAGEEGLPAIKRLRSAPETVINEVTVSYRDEDGRRNSITMRDQGSVDTYGLKPHAVSPGANITRQAAEDHALDILNAHSDVSDYYIMTFPLGPSLALEPNDILQVTADLDELSNTKMRVVSVELDPGSLGEGEIATITVNARRYSKARKGFGMILFGQGPFGTGKIMEN